MTAIDNPNLVLNFKLNGDWGSRVQSAARIEIDGRGGMNVYGIGSGSPQRITLSDLQSLSIRSMGCAGKPA